MTLADCIRRYVGAKDFINADEVRYCLWLKDVPPSVYRRSKEVMRRLAAVREMRLKSSAAPTRKMAETPYLFFSAPPLDGNYLALPEVSSERRDYIPIGFLSPGVIAANTMLVLPHATLYHFGVLTSSAHMAWMRAVAGRMKSDYRYSAAIVYNNFPWPEGGGHAGRVTLPNGWASGVGGRVSSRAATTAAGDSRPPKGIDTSRPPKGIDTSRPPKEIDAIDWRSNNAEAQRRREGEESLDRINRIDRIDGAERELAAKNAKDAKGLVGSRVPRDRDVSGLAGERDARPYQNPVNPDNPVKNDSPDLHISLRSLRALRLNQSPDSPDLHVKIAATAQAILDVRARYPGSSLADLYDPLTMPVDLRAAHTANDRAVLAAYGLAADTPEPEVVAHLFRLYAGKAKP